MIKRAKGAVRGLSIRSRVEMLFVVAVIVAASIMTASLISLSNSVKDSTQTAKANSTALIRRSPTTAFIACSVARIADYIYAGTFTSGADRTPEQIRGLLDLAVRADTAVLPTNRGGCLDPKIPVSIPPPINIPGVPAVR